MNTKHLELFEEIINSPQLASHLDIVKSQSIDNFQVPEPWNGDLDKGSYLVIGANPALDPHEVFPEKDFNSMSWCPIASRVSSTLWNIDYVVDFFENRFTGALCPVSSALPYVTFSGSKIYILKNISGSLVPKPAQNTYWSVYQQISSILKATVLGSGSCNIGNIKQINLKDIIVTDVVNFKGPKPLAMDSAVLSFCRPYLKQIVDFFVSNSIENSHKAIILIGATSKPVFSDVASAFNNIFKCLNPSDAVVGSFAGSGQIRKGDFNGIPVYYNIPAPSGANRAQFKNVSLYNCPIIM